MVAATTCLRSYTVEVVGADLELPAFVLVADADHEDLATVDPEVASILDNDAVPVEARNVRDHVVADFERVVTGLLSVDHGLQAITRDEEVSCQGATRRSGTPTTNRTRVVRSYRVRKIALPPRR